MKKKSIHCRSALDMEGGGVGVGVVSGVSWVSGDSEIGVLVKV